MIPYITATETGQILSCGHVQDALVDRVFIPKGTTLIKGVSISDPAQYYWDGAAAQPLPPRPSFEHEFDYGARVWKVSAAAVRRKRDRVIAASDWTQLPDVPLATKAAWAGYRQALRDLTDQPGFPDGVLWPVAPN